MTKENTEIKTPGITIPPDLEAVYANMARITHSPSEFIFDFAQMLPGFKIPAFKISGIVITLKRKIDL